MPTSQFPPVNPVDPTSQLNAIQSAISTLQSTVNGLSSSSPIQPKKPYRTGVTQTYNPGQWYNNLITISGKGVVQGAYAFIYSGGGGMNLQLVVDGNYYTLTNSAGLGLATGGGQGMEDHQSSIAFLAPIYFNSSVVVNFMSAYMGYNSSTPFNILIDYSLV